VISVLVARTFGASRLALRGFVALAVIAGLPARSAGQQPVPPTDAPPPVATPAAPPAPRPAPVPAAPASVAAPVAAVEVPPDYTIGPDDILGVVFWRDTEMTSDVVVRPDGRITLPLVNDVLALGLTPEQLRARIHAEAAKFIEDPAVTVVVKQINSRKVYVTGMVPKPGAYPLSGRVTVVQMLSMAGGVAEFADEKKIVIMRMEDGKQTAIKFNLRDVKKGKNLQQNIELKPGDTIVVP
jgi:polysaccharide biosynthesis/export protein